MRFLRGLVLSRASPARGDALYNGLTFDIPGIGNSVYL